jgi:hypothetical protein
MKTKITENMRLAVPDYILVDQKKLRSKIEYAKYKSRHIHSWVDFRNLCCCVSIYDDTYCYGNYKLPLFNDDSSECKIYYPGDVGTGYCQSWIDDTPDGKKVFCDMWDPKEIEKRFLSLLDAQLENGREFTYGVMDATRLLRGFVDVQKREIHFCEPWQEEANSRLEDLADINVLDPAKKWSRFFS